MKITSARIENAEEMCNLVKASIVELCAIDHNNDKKELADWLCNKTIENFRFWIKDHQSFCAFNDTGEMIGIVMLNQKNEILLNYVSPTNIKNGVGKRLLKNMEASLTKPCLIKVTPTKTALSFYLKMGFLADADGSEQLEKRLV